MKSNIYCQKCSDCIFRMKAKMRGKVGIWNTAKSFRFKSNNILYTTMNSILLSLKAVEQILAIEQTQSKKTHY